MHSNKRKFHEQARRGETNVREVGNDVDPTELLHEHDNESTERSATNARFCEKLEVSVTCMNRFLRLQRDGNVKQITSGLEGSVSEAQERLICISGSILEEEPTRGL